MLGGVHGKQTCSSGVGLQKGPFLATKWVQNGVILVGLGRGPRKVRSISFLVQKDHFWGPTSPS